MDFRLTDDQQMLADSIDRFGREAWPAADRPRLIADAGHAADDMRWRTMAELGWLALPVSEALGGLGGSPADVMIVAQGLGRHLLPAPFVSVCVAAAPLLGPAQQDVLDGVIAGATRVVLALGDAESRFDHTRISTTAAPRGDGFALTGEKHFVPDGADADWFIVPARTGDGVTLFLVAKDALGLEVSRIRSADNHRHARLRLDGVAGIVLGALGEGAAPLDRAVQRAILAHCAEAVGAMEALRDITLDFIKTRQQFGQPIGNFQVLQHRMVDIATQCEEARAITDRATLEAADDVTDGGRMIAAAKARVGQCGLFVGRQAVQLHGGVGTSDELVVGHYLKRLMMIDLAYGNADYHRDRFAGLN